MHDILCIEMPQVAMYFFRSISNVTHTSNHRISHSCRLFFHYRRRCRHAASDGFRRKRADCSLKNIVAPGWCWRCHAPSLQYRTGPRCFCSNCLQLSFPEFAALLQTLENWKVCVGRDADILSQWFAFVEIHALLYCKFLRALQAKFIMADTPPRDGRISAR